MNTCLVMEELTTSAAAEGERIQSENPEISAVGDENRENNGVEVTKLTGKAARKMKRLKNEPPAFIGIGEGPSEVRVLDFTRARATELKTMLKTLEGKGAVKRVFQYLPPHMRRRAMSHNPKRLPRRLRETASYSDKSSKQIDAAASRRKPPPSRKQKRKPSSLRTEFSRRQRENVWLETHLWHAKRMKMCNKYGMCLAEHCSDKGIRAAQRSLVYGCLLSDISYYQCYEISGCQNEIITCLKENFKEETGLTIKAKACLKGGREGRAVMYKAGMYPHGAISPVRFQWMAPAPPCLSPVPSYSCTTQPNEQQHMSVHEGMLKSKERDSCGSKVNKLWIWCHPASKNEVLTELQQSVQAYNQPGTTSRLVVTLVHRDLVRFRLVGPRSHAVLMETLKPVFKDKTCEGSKDHSEDDSGSDCEEYDGCDEGEMEDEVVIPCADKWWLEGKLGEEIDRHSQVFSDAYQTIKQANEPLEFSRGSVVGVCVEDPRLYTPSKKTDMVSSYYPLKKKQCIMKSVGAFVERNDQIETSHSEDSTSMSFDNAVLSSTIPECLPLGIAYSPLWDDSVSAKVSKSLIPCDVLNKKRSQRARRSHVLKLGDSAPCIPVLLIQQPLQQSSSLLSSRDYMGAGWDIILPPEWAMPFWISLIYRGARVCGMKELAKVSLETQVLHFPQDYPDTSSGVVHSVEQKRELEAQFMRKSPPYRLNYGKLVIPTPFHFPWQDLVSIWIKRNNPCDNGTSFGSIVDFDGTAAKIMKLERSDANSKGASEVIEVAHRREDVDFERTPYVLRCNESLRALRECVCSALSVRSQKQRSVSESDRHSVLRDIFWKYDINSILQVHGGALVAIRVEISRNGNLERLCSLSLPTLSDLNALLPNMGKDFSGPAEEMNQHGMTVIENGNVVVGISSLTRNEIKDLKQKRKKADCNSSFASDCHLFAPRPSRPILGYVTSAGHRITTSLDSGLGFITMAGLVEALTRCHSTGHTHLQILARGAKTKYYFVKIEIL